MTLIAVPVVDAASGALLRIQAKFRIRFAAFRIAGCEPKE